MQFGVFLLLQSPDVQPSPTIYDNAIKQAELADELGFNTVWLAEHHFSSYGYLPYPLMMAIKIAERTKSIRVGTAVLVLPLHHPIKLAEEIAMADQLTNGRIEIGFGRGYQEYEFDRLGVNIHENREMFDESLDIISKALQEETITYDGNYYKIPETAIFPKTIQNPHPPFWIAAQSPDSIKKVVQKGYKCITGGSSAPSGAVKQNWEVFQNAVEESGAGWPQEFAIQKQIYVAETEEEARKELDNAMWHYRLVTSLRGNTQVVEKGKAIEKVLDNEPDLDTVYDEWLIFGDPETCTKKIQKLIDTTGITSLNCVFKIGRMDNEKVMKSMKLFATQVMPQFKNVIGTGQKTTVKQ
tara:strand:- start:190 stop:1254 length:1065 start_codon:yes stop_codon:yes gene_type:complete